MLKRHKFPEQKLHLLYYFMSIKILNQPNNSEREFEKIDYETNLKKLNCREKNKKNFAQNVSHRSLAFVCRENAWHLYGMHTVGFGSFMLSSPFIQWKIVSNWSCSSDITEKSYFYPYWTFRSKLRSCPAETYQSGLRFPRVFWTNQWFLRLF